ncbi:deoxynucleotidyltransferase terminal-interacting protein 1-like isoform X2 [Rhopilema esculentum]|uniref:deoxynucleotidyltransferase terminal-interacting protein 1-like isoform X2 n=1 Tax=Rhopilema esculentum TaxID=499914 RepID=UPI0031D5BB5C
MVESSQIGSEGTAGSLEQIKTPQRQQHGKDGAIIRPPYQQRSFDGTPLSSKLKRKRESLSDGRHEPASNPFNMTAKNFPKRRPLGKTAIFMNRTRTSTGSNPAKALELVRSALQPSLNADIERVLQSYQEMFRMAAYNISDNTKEPLTEDHVKYILRRALDEAKTLFQSDNKEEEKDDEPQMAEKKRPMPIKPVIIKKKKMRREDHRPRDDYVYPAWDEARLIDGTEFIMGVKANKILGFASARGRLYTRHPDLFKYMADQDDKQWLYDNGHMPITGGKAFVMIADDIRTLATTHQDYKDNIGIKAEDVKGFVLPPFLFQKMKAAISRAALLRDVNKRPTGSSLVAQQTPEK